jgi:hypothetical protein
MRVGLGRRDSFRVCVEIFSLGYSRELALCFKEGGKGLHLGETEQGQGK